MELVHAFEYIDMYFVLDVNSGAVYSVDHLVYEIICKYKKPDEINIYHLLKENFQ